MALKDITSILPRSLDSFFFHNSPGVVAIIFHRGRLPPKGLPFSGFRFMKRWGILLVEVYERVGNLSFRSVKRPKRADSCLLWLSLSRENVLVLWFNDLSYFKDGTFTAVKRDANFRIRYVPFLSKIVRYKGVKGWTSGRSLPV